MTAFRSARLIIADALHLDQKSYRNRLILTLPLLALGVLVSQLDFTSIWNYFASTNQILAAIVLWTAAMYLRHEGKNAYIAAVPAAFMTAVTVTFVCDSRLYLGSIPFLSPVSWVWAPQSCFSCSASSGPLRSRCDRGRAAMFKALSADKLPSAVLQSDRTGCTHYEECGLG